MAQLHPLGQPFGAPSRVMNIPAPVGSERAGQELTQGLSGLGQVIGMYLGQKQQAGLQQQDKAALQAYGQYQQQLQQATGLQQQLSGLPLEQRQAYQGPVPQWPAYQQQPVMQSQLFKGLQSQAIAQQAFGAPELLTRPEQREVKLYGKRERPKPPSPSEQMTQKKLDRINVLENKILAGMATDIEKSQHDKLTGQYVEQIPTGYKEDLHNAISAIERGADKTKVFQRIAKTYPKRSAELRRIILAGEMSEFEKRMLRIVEQVGR